MNNRWRQIQRARSRYQLRDACKEIIWGIANYIKDTEFTYDATGGLNKLQVGDLLLTRDQLLRYWDEDMDCSCKITVGIDLAKQEQFVIEIQNMIW